MELLDHCRVLPEKRRVEPDKSVFAQRDISPLWRTAILQQRVEGGTKYMMDMRPG